MKNNHQKPPENTETDNIYSNKRSTPNNWRKTYILQMKKGSLNTHKPAQPPPPPPIQVQQLSKAAEVIA